MANSRRCRRHESRVDPAFADWTTGVHGPRPRWGRLAGPNRLSSFLLRMPRTAKLVPRPRRARLRTEGGDTLRIVGEQFGPAPHHSIEEAGQVLVRSAAGGLRYARIRDV